VARPSQPVYQLQAEHASVCAVDRGTSTVLQVLLLVIPAFQLNPLARVQVVAAVSALVAAFGPFEGGSSASGLNEFNICWIKFQAGESNGVADFNPYLWGLFFIPVILNSLFAICVYIYQWHRLKSGLSKT